MEAQSDRAIFLAGPTAVGKSEVAMELAGRVNGEIISVDSMQVYRGMDIGTAKPSLEDRQRVPHHLIDILDMNQGFDAAQFVRLAEEAVKEIQSRGRVPIFCGGTGLYFKAYLEGLPAMPPYDPEMRAQLIAMPLEELLRELAERDPATFETIDRKNARRVVRAVEIVRLTGKVREKVGQSVVNRPKSPMFGLVRPTSELIERIHRRVDEMFRMGLVEETKGLLENGLRENQTALQALGYRQVVEHLDGERGLAETIELVKIRTRQFAKRQLTWFRRQMGLEWVTLSPSFSCSEIDIAARSLNSDQSKSQ
jgi:tRNA dimethylallyltransferase